MGNRGNVSSWQPGSTERLQGGGSKGGGRVIEVFYYVRYQEELRSVDLQVFNQGWRGAGLCVWKHGPDVMLLVWFFFIPAALQENGLNWEQLSFELDAHEESLCVCVYTQFFLLVG